MQDSKASRSIFSGSSILLNHKWVEDQSLVIQDGRIKAIIPNEMRMHHQPAINFEFPKNTYLIPSFIDLHIHGAEGHDVMDGTFDSLAAISLSLAKEGVTGFLATTMTSSIPHIKNVLQTIANAMSANLPAKILGVHLEGPFIAKSKSGAQLETQVELPNFELFKQFQNAANNAIKIVTLAPELPGALQLISMISETETIASIGHTDATYDETMAAIFAGSSQATHFFNAMRGIHQREPGATGALLLGNVIAELIVDNIHLHPAIVKLAYQMKGKDHIALVTDAIRAKCLGDGQYELGGQQVRVKDRKATLSDGTLAGSTLRMPEAIKNMVAASGCSLPEAIAMATLTPARILKLDFHKGEIAIGKDADLVVLSHDFDVLMTMREGEVVYKS